MNTNKKTRNLAFLGVMLAITIILDVTPLGAIPLGTVSATITHIPTIITGIVLGPISGLIMGTSFGLISLIHALSRPATLFDPFFVNPLLSVLPRMFIGVLAYYGFSLVKFLLGKAKLKTKASLTIASAVSGVIGSMTNTILVLLMLYLLYGRVVLNKLVEVGLFESSAKLGDLRLWIMGIITTNAIMEAIVAAIITTALVVAYKTVIEKNID
jgi:uncharacterized membrane protein